VTALVGINKIETDEARLYEVKDDITALRVRLAVSQAKIKKPTGSKLAGVSKLGRRGRKVVPSTPQTGV
jgi:hypothetical protein